MASSAALRSVMSSADPAISGYLAFAVLERREQKVGRKLLTGFFAQARLGFVPALLYDLWLDLFFNNAT